MSELAVLLDVGAKRANVGPEINPWAILRGERSGPASDDAHDVNRVRWSELVQATPDLTPALEGVVILDVDQAAAAYVKNTSTIQTTRSGHAAGSRASLTIATPADRGAALGASALHFHTISVTHVSRTTETGS